MMELKLIDLSGQSSANVAAADTVDILVAEPIRILVKPADTK